MSGNYKLLLWWLRLPRWAWKFAPVSSSGKKPGWSEPPVTKAAGFFNPLSYPKIFPSYLPAPSYFPHFISRSFHLQRSAELLSFRGDVRHKAWGKWRAQRWTNVERKRQQKHFIPNVEAREKRTQGLRKVESSTLNERGEEKAREALHPKCRSERKKVSSFFSLHFCFFYVFFPFFLLEKKKTLLLSSLHLRKRKRRRL